MNIVETVFNGLYWVCRASNCVEQTFRVANDIQTFQEKDLVALKDYVRVACQIGTLGFDAYVLATDWNSSTLENKIKMKEGDIEKLVRDLNKNKAIAAQFNAMGFASHLVHNTTNGYLIDYETVYRCVYLAKANMQIKVEDQAIGTLTGIAGIIVGAGSGGLAISQFDRWYFTHGTNAPRISLDINYDTIPDTHHDNPVFSQFICPITCEPIRFPVTAPSIPGHEGHHFERKAIMQWLVDHNTNPVNQQPLRLNQLRENLDMRQLIENEMQKLEIPL